jgi:GNAT superfamily N-acetyltransferase
MTNTQGLCIRRAGPADAQTVTHLHVAVWRQTYADLAPAAAIEKLDEAHRLPLWQAALAPDAPDTTLLAEVGSQAVGFVRYGPASQPELGTGGEVKNLYILPAYTRRGLGRQLLARALLELKSAGYFSAALAVVEGNATASAFYLANGGRFHSSFTDAGPVWPSHNLVLRWTF